MWPKYLSNNVWRDMRLLMLASVMQHKMPDRIFAVDLPSKLFRATIANADTGSLKSLHRLFDKHKDHMLAKFEPNRMDQNVQNFELLTKKRVS